MPKKKSAEPNESTWELRAEISLFLPTILAMETLLLIYRKTFAPSQGR